MINVFVLALPKMTEHEHEDSPPAKDSGEANSVVETTPTQVQKKRKAYRGSTCCADALCSKRNGRDKSSRAGRQFLRFFRYPKDVHMKKRWSCRLKRNLKYFTPTCSTRVCSDHFNDNDFKQDSIQRFTNNSDPKKVVCIKLLKDAIPNTDRITGHYVRFGNSPKSKRSVRSLYRSDLSAPIKNTVDASTACTSYEQQSYFREIKKSPSARQVTSCDCTEGIVRENQRLFSCEFTAL